jgi:hypothetical protein
VEWVKGPVGVQSRNLRQQAASTRSAGAAQAPIKQGFALTYPWIEAQVKKTREEK